MTVKHLMKILSTIDPDKMVILTEPDGIGWTNIGEVIETKGEVKLTQDDNGLFQES